MDFYVAGLVRLLQGVAENWMHATWRIKVEDTNLVKDQATVFTMDSSSKILYFHKSVLLE